MPVNPDPARSDILDGLPSTTNKYPYKGRANFLRVVSTEQSLLNSDEAGKKSQFIVFTNINESTFTRDFIFIHSHEDNITHAVESYSPASQVLLVKMTTKDLQQAHMGIFSILVRKLSKMNDRNGHIIRTRSTLLDTPSRKKRADQEFYPEDSPPEGPHNWPPAIAESGYSESRPKLQADARWWLTASHGDVTTALTVSVHREKRKISIQRWELDDCMRAEPARKIPHLIQHVVVSKRADATVDVANAPLIVPLENLLLRRANGDILLTVDDLKTWADKIWLVQNLS